MDKNGVGASDFAINESYQLLLKSLKNIEMKWLPLDSKKKFMFGDLPSIADLSLAGEIANCEAMKLPIEKLHPSVYKWLYTHMMSIPGYAKIHNIGIPKMKKTIRALKGNDDDKEKELQKAKM